MLMVLALAWAYVKFGSMPQAQQLLYGIKPVVIAIIAQAIWTLGRKAARTFFLEDAGAVILGLYFFLHINEIALLFGGGLVIMLLVNIRRLSEQSPPRVSSAHWQPGHQHPSLLLRARPSACLSFSSPS